MKSKGWNEQGGQAVRPETDFLHSSHKRVWKRTFFFCVLFAREMGVGRGYQEAIKPKQAKKQKRHFPVMSFSASFLSMQAHLINIAMQKSDKNDQDS